MPDQENFALTIMMKIQDTIECQYSILALLFPLTLNTFLFLISCCVVWVKSICLMTKKNDDLMILKMKVLSVMSWTAVLYLL